MESDSKAVLGTAVICLLLSKAVIQMNDRLISSHSSTITHHFRADRPIDQRVSDLDTMLFVVGHAPRK